MLISHFKNLSSTINGLSVWQSAKCLFVVLFWYIYIYIYIYIYTYTCMVKYISWNIYTLIFFTLFSSLNCHYIFILAPSTPICIEKAFTSLFYSKFRSYIWGNIRPTLIEVDIMLATMFWYIVSRKVGTAFDRLQCKCWLTTDLLPTIIHNITVNSL